MKLARAAKQQLKGVVVEYDALCSTLLGKSTAERQEERNKRGKVSAEHATGTSSTAGSTGNAVEKMFVSDVRALLKDLNQDSSGKPWVIKDRLQSTLQGLPSDMLRRLRGDAMDDPLTTIKTQRGEIDLEKRLSGVQTELSSHVGLSTEKDQMKTTRTGLRTDSSTSSNSIRAKYLSKLNKLKEKARTGQTTNLLDSMRENDGPVSKGLTTWVVNPGANELLSYALLRGLAVALVPNRSPLQDEEYEAFVREMDSKFDAIMPRGKEVIEFPSEDDLHQLLLELRMAPSEILVVATHRQTIEAAGSLGAHTCQFSLPSASHMSHGAHFQLSHLRDFQHIVEEFNGISYRR